MARIKMIGAMPRKSGMSEAAFHDHYRHPHGTLGATLSFVRAYTQSHQFDSDLLPASQARFDACAEVWLEDMAAVAAMATDPGYHEHLVPDEPLFIDMDNLRVIFCIEEIVQEGPSGDGASQTLWRLDQRPTSIKLLQFIHADGDIAWAHESDADLGERLGAFRHVRCHPIREMQSDPPFAIGVRELWWPSLTALREGVAGDRDAWHTLLARPAEATALLAVAERFL